RVASVAWAAAQGDLLAAMFYLAAVLAYLHAHDARQAGSRPRPWLVLSLLGMALSVLAGNNVATSVAIVLLLDIYPLRRLGGGPGRWFGPAVRPVWREKAPFLAIAIATAVVAWFAHAHIDILRGMPDRTFARRLAESFFGLSLGMWKTFWPGHLPPVYAFSDRSAAAAIGVLAAVGLLAWLLRRRWAAPLAGWLCYAFLLLPLLGVFAGSEQTEVDRLSYLACLGWAMVFGGALAWFLQPAGDGRRSWVAASAAAAVVVAVVVGLSVRTQRQCDVWNTSASLWEYAVAHEPDSAMARMYLGEYLLNHGDSRAAAHQLSEAARLCPGNGRVQCDLGIALYETDDLAEASAAFRRAIALDPNNDSAYRGLGRVLADQNDFDAAMEQLRIAQRLNPDEFRVYVGIGWVLQQQGRPDAAAAVYEEGIRRWPDVEVFYTLRGASLIDAGQYAEGRKTLEMGLRVTDDPAELANSLAWLLATCRDETQRDGAAAVRFAELAERATLAQNPAVTDTLAAAYAEAGRFDDAIRTQKRAIELARFVRPQVVPEFRERLALFEKHQPYREQPSTRPAASMPAASQRGASR
ncbi:MAG: tetratricopeptide repeat protein, partial [Phycisphaerae bacterium]